MGNKVRESFKKRFYGANIPTVAMGLMDRIEDWLKEFDEPDHSIALHCDGPDKGKDTRTPTEIRTADKIYFLDSRLAKVEENVANHEQEIGELKIAVTALEEKVQDLIKAVR